MLASPVKTRELWPLFDFLLVFDTALFHDTASWPYPEYASRILVGEEGRAVYDYDTTRTQSYPSATDVSPALFDLLIPSSWENAYLLTIWSWDFVKVLDLCWWLLVEQGQQKWQQHKQDRPGVWNGRTFCNLLPFGVWYTNGPSADIIRRPEEPYILFDRNGCTYWEDGVGQKIEEDQMGSLLDKKLNSLVSEDSVFRFQESWIDGTVFLFWHIWSVKGGRV